MQLSIRMQAVADMVTPGGRIADIGTDHGYVPIYLVEQNKTDHAIAMDVRKGPLARAGENIVRFGCSDRIETRLSDGLAMLKPGEADTVIIAENGIEAMEKISANPDIILLDVNMPGMDGIEVCRRIRDMVSCPIIFLTAKVEEQDRVMGLLSGGDDYVLKPFSLKELDARIIAHLKREERLHRKKEQRFYGELVIDYASKCVHIKGNALELTKLEYEIIEFLSMNPEMVFDKERIYEKIGGYDAEGDSRVVTELIRRIRKKMKMYSEHEYIATVWGRGYKWAK